MKSFRFQSLLALLVCLCLVWGMGCAPAADRSTMDRRRCPSAMPASASSQWPSASGPRWAMASVMACSGPKAASVCQPPPRKPVNPHISGHSGRLGTHQTSSCC